MVLSSPRSAVQMEYESVATIGIRMEIVRNEQLRELTLRPIQVERIGEIYPAANLNALGKSYGHWQRQGRNPRPALAHERLLRLSFPRLPATPALAMFLSLLS